MNMNVPHLHLLLNHIPTIGGAAALVLLIIAFVRKSDDLKRIALEATYVVATTMSSCSARTPAISAACSG